MSATRYAARIIKNESDALVGDWLVYRASDYEAMKKELRDVTAEWSRALARIKELESARSGEVKHDA